MGLPAGFLFLFTIYGRFFSFHARYVLVIACREPAVVRRLLPVIRRTDSSPCAVPTRLARLSSTHPLSSSLVSPSISPSSLFQTTTNALLFPPPLHLALPHHGRVKTYLVSSRWPLLRSIIRRRRADGRGRRVLCSRGARWAQLHFTLGRNIHYDSLRPHSLRFHFPYVHMFSVADTLHAAGRCTCRIPS